MKSNISRRQYLFTILAVLTLSFALLSCAEEEKNEVPYAFNLNSTVEVYADCVVKDFFNRNSERLVVPEEQVTKSISRCSKERRAVQIGLQTLPGYSPSHMEDIDQSIRNLIYDILNVR